MKRIQIELIKSQYIEAKERYPGLSLIQSEKIPIVRGPLDFRAEFDDETINSVLNVEISFPDDYPDSPPFAKEIGGCISQEFHKFTDEYLCLGAPLIVKTIFTKRRTLLGFIENILIPYLYSFCYWEKHGVMPYGELSHGFKGIIESYKEVFKTTSDYVALGLLKILAEDNYRGHLQCPCETGTKLRNCHGSILLEIKKHTDKEWLLYDFLCYFFHLHKSGKNPPKVLLSAKIQKAAKKMFGQTNEK